LLYEAFCIQHPNINTPTIPNIRVTPKDFFITPPLTILYSFEALVVFLFPG